MGLQISPSSFSIGVSHCHIEVTSTIRLPNFQYTSPSCGVLPLWLTSQSPAPGRCNNFVRSLLRWILDPRSQQTSRNALPRSDRGETNSGNDTSTNIIQSLEARLDRLRHYLHYYKCAIWWTWFFSCLAALYLSPVFSHSVTLFHHYISS